MSKHLLIAAIPRTASSFVIRTFNEVLELPECPPRIFSRKGVPLTMESDLYDKDWAAVHGGQNTIGKLHCRGTSQNLNILAKYNVKVIFLYRNIFDIIVSLRDHHNTGSIGQTRSLFLGNWMNLTREEQLDAIIDFYIPRFLFMYVTWQFAERAGFPVKQYDYRDVVSNPITILSDMLEFGRFGRDDYDIARLEKCVLQSGKKHNFNKGIQGRGLELLSKEQVKRVRRMMRYFKDIDMSRLEVE